MVTAAQSVYQWGHSYGVFNAAVSAQIVGERIESLRAEIGEGITPTDLLTDATPESAPTHNLFEWDDTEAGYLYREHQARNVLNTLRLVVAASPDQTANATVVIANVSVREKGGRAYFPMTSVLQHADMIESALEDVRRYLAGFASRYSELKGSNATLDKFFTLLEELNNGN